MSGSHISLFSGIGATDIAAEAAGFQTVATAEVNPFCRRLLKVRFPHAVSGSDVRLLNYGDWVRPDGSELFQRPLLMSGGFPCQDVASLRGSDDGLNKARSGLWSEFARLIGEFRPDYVLIENSPLLRSRGLGRILRALWELGYDAKWECIPAAQVGAPHLRDRIWIMARPTKGNPSWWNRACGYMHANQDIIVDGRQGAFGEAWTRFKRAGEMCGKFVREVEPEYTIKDARAIHGGMKMYPTPRSAPNEWRTTRNAPSHGKSHGATLAGTLNDEDRAAGFLPAPSSESAGNIDPGVVEWFMGLPYGWTNPNLSNAALGAHTGWHNFPMPPFSRANVPHRRDRLVALGNALVPQVASIAIDTLIKDWR